MTPIYRGLHRTLAVLGLILGLALGLSFPSFAETHGKQNTPALDIPAPAGNSNEVRMPDCGQSVVDKALALKEEVENANQEDLKYLWSLLAGKLQKMSWPERESLIDRIIAKVRADKATLMRVKEALDKKEKYTPDWGSFPLRTSLVKLVGSQTETGILDDVITQLSKPEAEGNPFAEQSIGKLKPMGNASTVLKTLLVYSNLVIRDHNNLNELVLKHHFDEKVRICYPAEYPSHLEGEELRNLGVYCEGEGLGKNSRLYVPNSGYIYGGNFFEGQCRGIDCSSFVSYCTSSTERLWTGAMAKIAEYYLIPEKDLTPEQLMERQKDLKTEWFPKMLRDFGVVNHEGGEKVRPGDLVVWKGHTAIYLGPSKLPNHFVGIEANRTDDKQKEGILVENMPFKRETSPYTYVIRRTPVSMPKP